MPESIYCAKCFSQLVLNYITLSIQQKEHGLDYCSICILCNCQEKKGTFKQFLINGTTFNISSNKTYTSKEL